MLKLYYVRTWPFDTMIAKVPQNYFVCYIDYTNERNSLYDQSLIEVLQVM